MSGLISLHDRIFGSVERIGDAILPLLARLVFAGTLLTYFWASAATKLGDGPLGFLSVTAGGFGQIYPRAAEAVLWDVTQMTALQKAVVLAGTWAEFLLPLLIVIGLATRLAALGMIVFVVVQSLTDLFGHGGLTQPETLGAWFDRAPDAAILDQRAFWVLLLTVLVVRGAGALSVDAALRARGGGLAPA